jgi:putative transposase
MPRRPRLHVPGALYHIVLRGNYRQDIFFTPEDHHAWEKLVGLGVERYGHRVHAYCWMTNHVHLAIQASARPLGTFVNKIASGYARWMHRRLGRTGHFFERRYRAVLVDSDSYALELVRYIHLNPVRAGISADAADYAWSSHRAYLGAAAPAWLTQTWILSLFAATESHARRRFAAFMASPPDDAVIDRLRAGRPDDQRLLGDDLFLAAVTEKSELTLPSRVTLDEIIVTVSAVTGVRAEAFASSSRQRDLVSVRAIVAAVAAQSRAVTQATVARRFGRAEASISRRVQRLTATEQALVNQVCDKLRS